MSLCSYIVFRLLLVLGFAPTLELKTKTAAIIFQQQLAAKKINFKIDFNKLV
jgi:hypothetical protein